MKFRKLQGHEQFWMLNASFDEADAGQAEKSNGDSGFQPELLITCS
jgi:hypothetical protein